MTMQEIQLKQETVMTKFTLAKQIRLILEEAKKKYGETEWENDDMETEINELVFGDE